MCGSEQSQVVEEGEQRVGWPVAAGVLFVTPLRVRPTRGGLHPHEHLPHPGGARSTAAQDTAAIAVPTSTGSCSWSTRPPLPCTAICPARQSRSSNVNVATSLARSPSRSISTITA